MSKYMRIDDGNIKLIQNSCCSCPQYDDTDIRNIIYHIMDGAPTEMDSFKEVAEEFIRWGTDIDMSQKEFNDKYEERFKDVDGRFDDVDDKFGDVDDKFGDVDGELGEVNGKMKSIIERVSDLEKSRDEIVTILELLRKEIKYTGSSLSHDMHIIAKDVAKLHHELKKIGETSIKPYYDTILTCLYKIAKKLKAMDCGKHDHHDHHIGDCCKDKKDEFFTIDELNELLQ